VDLTLVVYPHLRRNLRTLNLSEFIVRACDLCKRRLRCILVGQRLTAKRRLLRQRTLLLLIFMPVLGSANRNSLDDCTKNRDIIPSM